MFAEIWKSQQSITCMQRVHQPGIEPRNFGILSKCSASELLVILLHALSLVTASWVLSLCAFLIFAYNLYMAFILSLSLFARHLQMQLGCTCQAILFYYTKLTLTHGLCLESFHRDADNFFKLHDDCCNKNNNLKQII